VFKELAPERRYEMKVAAVKSAVLFIGFIIVSTLVLSRSFLYDFDHWIKALRHHTFKGMSSHAILAIDDLGLRSLTATILILYALAVGYRFKTWRPLNLSLLALLLLNGVVGLSKLIFGRAKPRLALDLLHSGGLSYPSGHAANALLSWGLLSYLIFRYSHRYPFTGVNLNWLVGVITTAVCVVSLIRNTHWFSDLLGGVLLGGSILVFLIAVDRAWPSQRQPA